MELDKNVGENGGKPNFGGNPPGMNGNTDNSRTNKTMPPSALICCISE
ncbi:MAG: hypothetical protein SOW78_06600 [Clostridia bacterium]|nr:hypothetical protein [Clostridia bacterium]